MPTIAPYAGTSLQRLVALINQNASQPITTPADFTLTRMTALVSGQYNTRIRFKPTSSAFVEQDLYYQRLSLSALSRLPAGEILPVVVRTMPFTIHSILPALNSALGLDLQPDEVFNSYFDTEQTHYPLQVRANQSLAWIPSSYMFEVDLQVQAVRLLENGTRRILESGGLRLLEGSPVDPT